MTFSKILHGLHLGDPLRAPLSTVSSASTGAARWLWQLWRRALVGRGLRSVLPEIRPSSGVVCEIDAAWPDDRVGLDYDSPEFHGPRRWGRDEDRHAAAEALGWDFVSVDKTDLMPGSHARFRGELTALLGTTADAATRQVGG